MKIGVFPAQELAARSRLWDALAALYSLDFAPCCNAEAITDCDAAFIFADSQAAAEDIAARRTPCMAFIGGLPAAAPSTVANVTVADDPNVRRCFRGRTLPDKAVDSVAPLEPGAGDCVLARKGDQPLWLRRDREGAALQIVAADAPRLTDGEYLFEHFQSDRWARLFPILHFLQDVSGWTQPPVRAAIMFDDPNLHWKSYGYISYPALAEHARNHNYHVSFATIPLDGWYVHPQTAALFRANRDRLSLCIHGNNHTYYELTEAPTDEHRLALAAQALNRIEQFEATSGLQVSRVMAAPHGACNHAMATALAMTGFEAACISRSSVMIRNPGTAWPLTVGMTPAEFLGNGLPVYPRYNIRWDETYPIFSAFLGQPVVPVGHHEDSADGFELLRRSAELINSLGEVQWMDLQAIARTNFITQREGEVLHVKMYSRSTSLVVPEGIERLGVASALPQQGGREELVLQNGAEAPIGTEELVRVRPGEKITLRSIRADRVDRTAVKLSRTPLWAVARRQLCEGRDRLRPTIDKLRALRNGAAAPTE